MDRTIATGAVDHTSGRKPVRRSEGRDGGVMPTTTLISEAGAPLSAVDRCDRCGAAARVRVTLASGGELLFCRHHANEHADVLRAANAVIDFTPDEEFA
jgi:hypothetical protein